jgi:hypothetical protein
MRICYDPEVDAVYARVAEPTGPARTEVLESGVAVERSAEADGGAYGFEFIMVKSRGLPTIDLRCDVALSIEEFVASGALESRDEQQQITPIRLLLSPPNQQDDRRSLGPQQRASGPLNLVSVGIHQRTSGCSHPRLIQADGDVSNEVFDYCRDEPRLSEHEGAPLRAPRAGLMSRRYAASARESCFATADRASESRLPLRTHLRSSSELVDVAQLLRLRERHSRDHRPPGRLPGDAYAPGRIG